MKNEKVIVPIAVQSVVRKIIFDLGFRGARVMVGARARRRLHQMRAQNG
jgi:hypothetical protein